MTRCRDTNASPLPFLTCAETEKEGGHPRSPAPGNASKRA